jgi:hypothetical protein
VLECTRRIFHPFYNGSTVLLGDLVSDALDTGSIQSLSGSTGPIEQRAGQRVPSIVSVPAHPSPECPGGRLVPQGRGHEPQQVVSLPPWVAPGPAENLRKPGDKAGTLPSRTTLSVRDRASHPCQFLEQEPPPRDLGGPQVSPSRRRMIEV